MPIPHRSKFPTDTPGLQWLVTDDGSRTLWNEGLDETYHSGCGAVAESLIVYLQNSGTLARLQSLQKSSVLEYGFGTGTAFLLTAAAAENYATPLLYRGLERDLLPSTLFEELRLDQSHLAIDYLEPYGPIVRRANGILAQLIAFRKSLPSIVPPGMYTCELSKNIKLELWIGDAVEYQCDLSSCDSYDAIYFDAFSPESCPELWNTSIFGVAFQSLRAGGTLTSYCVKSVVRHSLSEVGFEVSKALGPIGGKREVLLARKPPAVDEP